MVDDREEQEAVLRFLEEEVARVKERISASERLKDGVLEYVKGVGRKTSEALKAQGIKTTRDLSESNPHILAGLTGWSLKRTERLIENAKTPTPCPKES